MENQFALWLAIMFGFTSCTLTEEEQFEADLVGTWMEVRTSHSTNGSDEWVSTERKTIILERVNDRLRFRNCIDDTHATAAVLDEQVTLSSDDYPVLELSDPDTLTGVTAIDGTEVVLQRVSAETSTVQAEFSLTQPQPMNTWTDLCLQTLVTDSGESRLAFKAINSLVGVKVGMSIESPTRLDEAQTLSYPSQNDDEIVTGEYEILSLGSGTLSDPNGSVIVSESTTWDFEADLVMEGAADDGSGDDTVIIDGLLSVDPEWFAHDSL